MDITFRGTRFLSKPVQQPRQSGNGVPKDLKFFYKLTKVLMSNSLALYTGNYINSLPLINACPCSVWWSHLVPLLLSHSISGLVHHHPRLCNILIIKFP